MDQPLLWIVEGTYTKPVSELTSVAAHRTWQDQHVLSGTIVVSGRRADMTGGILVAQGQDEATLRALFAQDPLNLAGEATYTFTAFLPGKRSSLLDLPQIPLIGLGTMA